MADGFSEQDVRLVADAIWRRDWGLSPLGRPSKSRDEQARAALAALAAAGRLLPEGGESFANYVLRWFGADLEDGFVEWGCVSLEHARELAQKPPQDAVWGEIGERKSWVGPWSVVEPVAGKEAP